MEVKNPVIKQNGTEISIVCETDGSTIYYSTDGSDPSINSTIYEGEFIGSAGNVIKAIAIKDNVSSEIVSFKLQFNVLFIAVDDLKPIIELLWSNPDNISKY